MTSNYLLYSDFLNNKSINNKIVMIAKTKKSYIIGPLINNNFDFDSFYKRLKSNSIYTSKIYKRVLKLRAKKLIDQYINLLEDNMVIEVYKNKRIVKHYISNVPGDSYEKE